MIWVEYCNLDGILSKILPNKITQGSETAWAASKWKTYNDKVQQQPGPHLSGSQEPASKGKCSKTRKTIFLGQSLDG